MSNEIRQVFQIGDKSFATRAEAQNFLRLPKIRTAMLAVTAGKADLTDWLVANQEAVEMAFEVGTIRRVTKSEKNKLEKALAYLVEKFSDDPKLNFLTENAGAIKDSFRWPTVQRMTDEQKNTAARNSLVAAAEGNEELADWIIQNKEPVLAAYKAGIEKREIPDSAKEGLAAYRAKKAAEKALKEQASA